MKRFWVSWWSGNYADEGCTKPPFQFFVTGYRDRNDDSGKDDCSICAWIEAPSEQSVLDVIQVHFPDYEARFINEVESDFVPNNRFPNATMYTIKEVVPA